MRRPSTFLRLLFAATLVAALVAFALVHLGADPSFGHPARHAGLAPAHQGEFMPATRTAAPLAIVAVCALAIVSDIRRRSYVARLPHAATCSRQGYSPLRI